MRTELTYIDGYWWKRISDNSIHKNLILGDWDSLENYIQITSEEKLALEATIEELEAEQQAIINEINTLTNG